jgi:uncharacterized protein YndB with AHSA1/START domain
MSDMTKQKLIVERTYRARPEELWALWTTKEGFESWWGPQGFRVEVQAIEPQVGGALKYDMIADTPEMKKAMKEMGQPPSHKTHGTFTEVKPHARLAITHVIDFIPGVKHYDATMLVEFIPVGDRVRMVVHLAGMHNAEFDKMQLEGFTSQIGKLDQRFERS